MTSPAEFSDPTSGRLQRPGSLQTSRARRVRRAGWTGSVLRAAWSWDGEKSRSVPTARITPTRLPRPSPDQRPEPSGPSSDVTSTDGTNRSIDHGGGNTSVVRSALWSRSSTSTGSTAASTSPRAQRGVPATPTSSLHGRTKPSRTTTPSSTRPIPLRSPERPIGYSRTARMVIVVVYLRDELVGVNAWKANETQTHRYWEDQR